MSARVIEVKTLQASQLNGAIARIGDRYLLVYRQSIGTRYIGGQLRYAWLTDDYRLASEPLMIHVGGFPEDPRVLVLDSRIIVTFTRLEDDGYFHHYMQEFEVSGDHLLPITLSPIELVHPETSGHQHEKNWIPFVYDEELWFVYSLEPFEVLKYLASSRTIVTAFRHEPKCESWVGWGRLRGGTPAILDDGSYLCVFHSSIYTEGNSSIPDARRRYFMGAFRFSSAPPFEPRAISSRPLQIRGLTSSSNRISAHEVVFPVGLVANDKSILLSVGDMDSRTKLVEISRTELCADMNSVFCLNTERRISDAA